MVDHIFSAAPAVDRGVEPPVTDGGGDAAAVSGTTSGSADTSAVAVGPEVAPVIETVIEAAGVGAGGVKPGRVRVKRVDDAVEDEASEARPVAMDLDSGLDDGAGSAGVQEPAAPVQAADEEGEAGVEEVRFGGLSQTAWLTLGGAAGLGVLLAASSDGGSRPNTVPTAGADTATATEGGAVVTGSAASNDSDADGDALTYALASPVAGLTLNANGAYSFDPTNAAYNGLKAGQTQAVTATYTVSDGRGGSASSTLTITVTGTNDAPVAVANAYAAVEDTALVVAAAAGVLANDSDPDGDALSAILVAGPAHGTLALNANGSFTYTPTANYAGPDSFTYKVNDGTVDGNTVTVNLTVAAVNDAPVATADVYTATEDTTLVVTAAAGVLANDTDVDGNPLTAALVAGPANGVLAFSSNGGFSYTPNANYSGTDSFTYRVNDGTVDGNTVTVSLTVAPVNDAPVARADAYAATEDTPLVVTAAAGVLANDTDVEGGALTAVLVAGPAHGTLVLNANGSFTYTPTANYAGPDSFTYRANDGTVDGDPVTVSLTVAGTNDAPVATADVYTVAEDTTLTLAAAAGVLANDADPDGDALTAILVSGPANGTLALNPNGGLVYTPNANYTGPDSFTYKVNDGAVDGNTVTVSLTVTPVNDAPVAAADAYGATEDTVLVVTAAAGVLANDTDVEGGALTAVLATGPAHGTLVLNPDGGFTYTPNADYTGADSFTYRASDGAATGDPVTVNLTVAGVNDAPVAAGDAYTVSEDATLSVGALAGVTANDTDVDGDPLSAVLVTGPANGILVFRADGSFDYTPAADYAGPDSFTYKVNDGTVDGNTVTVSLTVTPVNDAPVATADAYGATEDAPLVVAAGAGVLANDTDLEGDPLTAVVVTGPAHGTLALNPDGSFTYTPDADYAGADSFTYKANDGAADSAAVTVNLTVGAVNDAPVSTGDAFTVAEDGVLTVAAGTGVLANDADVDGDPLTAAVVAGPTNGLLTLNPDGSFTYTPNADYSGTDSFTYRANDGTVDGNTVTVSLTVTPVNDAPVAAADAYSVDEDTTLIIPAPGVLGNDTDVDGDPLSAAVVSGPSNGVLTPNADGSFSYTPNANYNGPDSFTYRVNDGTVDGNTVTVSLTVNPVNDAPVANDDAYAALEDAALTVSAASGVLANDTDIDGGALSVSAVSGGTVGAQFALASGALLTLNADGSYVYNPNGQFENLRPGQTGTDSFTYTVSDGAGGTDTATATITINGANEAPVAIDDAFTMTGNTPITFTIAQLTGNDIDDDATANLSVSAVGGATNGVLVDNGDGTFTFTPATGFTGTASFTYTLTDADGGTDTGAVTLTVTDPVWYVNAATGSDTTGDGSFARPFASLAPLSTGGSADALDNANDTIFVYNAGTYTTGIVLESGQILYGDGHAFTVNGMAIGANTTNTTISHAGAGVTLSTNNTIMGLDLVGTASANGAVGIVDGGGAVGTLTVSNVAISGLGQIIEINQGGTLAVTLNSVASTGSSDPAGLRGAINLAGVAGAGLGGTFTVTGATDITGSHGGGAIDILNTSGLTANFLGDMKISLTSARHGIDFSSNNNSQLNLSGAVKDIDTPLLGSTALRFSANTNSTANIIGGGLDIDTVAGVGLASSSGTTVQITGAGNSITTATGQILSVSGVVGAGGLNFDSLAATGIVNGTAIQLTSATGGALISASTTIAGSTNHGVLVGSSTNTVSLGSGSIGNSTTATGRNVLLEAGSFNFEFNGAITRTSDGNIIEIRNKSGGTVLFGGAISATADGDGILLTNNTGGTIDFTGDVTLNTGAGNGLTFTNTSATGANVRFTEGSLDIDTTSGTGINATSTTIGAGSLTLSGATGPGNIVTSTTGRAINIDGVTSNITLNEVNAGAGSTTAVFLRNTGASGQFVVTGDGSTAASGGVVSGRTGANNLTTEGIGFYLENVSNVSLSNMNISGIFENFGIRGSSVNNFTLRDSTVSGQFGNNLAIDEDAIRFGTGGGSGNGLTGTALFEGNNISGGYENNLSIYNYGSGSLNFTMRDSANDAAVVGSQGVDLGGGNHSGNDGVQIETMGAFNLTVLVDGVNFTAARGDFLQVVAGGNTTQNIAVQNNTFHNGHVNVVSGGGGITLSGGGNTSDYTTNYLIHNNTFKGAQGSAIYVNYSGQDVSASGVISNNVIGTNNGVFDSTQANGGSTASGNGISVYSEKFLGGGTVEHAVRIQNNQVFDIASGAGGIYLLAGSQGGGTTRMEATVTGNTVAESGPDLFAAFYSVIGGAALSGDNTQMGLNISNNTTMVSGTGGGGSNAFYFDQVSRDANYYFPGYVGSGQGEFSTPAGTASTDLTNFIDNIKGNNGTNGPGASSPGIVEAGALDGATGGNFVLPVPLLLLGGNDGWENDNTVGDNGELLTADRLAPLIDAAIARWAAAGATAEQVAAMRAVDFGVFDMAGAYLGQSVAGAIALDSDAGGRGWFIDATPADDSEFANGVATADGGAAGKVDLLTTLMHELGHQIGLDDLHGGDAANDLMHGFLDLGERHLPELDHVGVLAAGSDPAPTAGLTGWTAELVSLSADPEATESGSFMAAGDIAGVQGWVSELVLEADVGGLDALLAGYAESSRPVMAWDAGAVVVDPLGLPPIQFDQAHPVI